MPSLSSYTPFESLLFFQTLAALDSRPDSFAPVSEALRSNPFVQQDVQYDAARLSPQALEELYTTLLAEGIRSSDDEASDHSHQGAQDPSANLKKRKRIHDAAAAKPHAAVMPDLVNRLYARYKQRVTKEIRREEQRYAEIKDHIRRLEAGEDLPTPSAAASAAPPAAVPAPVPEEDTAEASPLPSQEKPSEDIPHDEVPAKSPSQTPVSTGPPGEQLPQQPQQPLQQQQQQKQPTPGLPPGIPQQPPVANTPTFKQPPPPSSAPTTTIPTPATLHASSVRTNPYANIQPFPSTTSPHPPTYQHSPQLVPLSRPTPPSRQPSPIVPPTNPSWTKPPSQPAPKPVIQTVKFQPLLTPQTIPQSSYGHGSPRTTPKPSNQSRGKPTPVQKTAAPITDGANVPQNPPLSAPPAVSTSAAPVSTPTPPSRAAQPVSVTPDVTPLEKLRSQLPSFAQSLGRRPPKPSLSTTSGNTPWKIPGPISLPGEPGSPERPLSADISPISERALSPSRQDGSGQPSGRSTRRKLDLSSARGTAPKHPGKDGVELPSPTTLPSGRPRTRGQSNASRGEEPARTIKNELPSTPVGIPVEDVESSQYRTKRKRSPISLDHEHRPSDLAKDSQYVICSRTFGRTCGPIMNDVAAHKYASIFAKPLTNRDAPGYRDLIYRPQDIKTIKSSIHQGSRAVAAVSEAMTPAQMTDEVPPAAAATTGSGVAISSKGNVLLATKSAELMPPKGIVNSSQLEKELIRMFANAIMFNPTPDSTFGPSFPMRSDSVSRQGSQSAEPDEGGIINDTLEMYEDVEKAISTWRSAERPVDDAGGKGFLALRRGTPGDANEAVED